MCVISDDKGVLGLGGIIGGIRSGTEMDTQNVLIESADSIKTFCVSISVPDLIPPMIPPSPNTPLSSLITHISSSSL